MYDLLILAFNEKKSAHLHSKSICVKATNRNGHKIQKYYHELWPFINNSYGILYKLFTKESLGKFECCDEMFNFNTVNDYELDLQQLIPNLSPETAEDCVSMKLDKDFKEEFVALFDVLLSCSPVSTIAFLCRGQSFDEEIIVGTLSHNDFIEKLCSGDVRTNICYIVKL